MASTSESPKKKVVWTPELDLKLFISLLETMPSTALDYEKIAEKLGEGYTKSTVYQRLYYLKNKLNPAGSATSPRTKAAPKGKKRKIDEDTA